ncbi:retrovirus-related Pol polyprotein from transposon 412 [Trichonephila clavipes]|nr:retrovirus-related Pol polyprotein from transposon 412 [Trichonephila clavipes]
MVERFNQTILNSLSLLVSSHQQDWDKKLPFFLLAYRSAVHETTGYSPAQMLFGRDLRLPADLLFIRPPDAPLVPEEYIEKQQARMEEMQHLARERIGMTSKKMKTRYDARATGHDFGEGNKVWLWNPKRRKGLSPKLQTNCEGPYTVLKRLNDVVVRIQKSPHSKNQSDLVLKPPKKGKYEALKKRLIEVHSESEDSKIRTLLQGLELEDQRPSQLLTRMRSLAGDNVGEPLLKSLWLGRLPNGTQTILAALNESLDQLATVADKINDLTFSPGINSVAETSEKKTA